MAFSEIFVILLVAFLFVFTAAQAGRRSIVATEAILFVRDYSLRIKALSSY